MVIKMSSTEVHVENKAAGRCLLDNWVEERATELLDNTRPRSHIHKNGHKGILTTDTTSKVHGVSTAKAAFTNPTGPDVRLRGLRAELLEKHLIKRISEQLHAELNPEPLAPELFSVTRADYTVEGFQLVRPAPSKHHDYKAEQAITFWSENYNKVQGVTPVKNRDAPFKKNATFSTPISECMEDSFALSPGN